MPSRPSDSREHPHELPLWTPEERAARQRAALRDYTGDALEQHEVEFVERMQRRGERLRWIPKAHRDRRTGRTEATNDFVWETKDGPTIVTELKSTSTNHRRIAGRIRDAVLRARPVVKENFVVDLGPAPMSASLEHKLGNYNRNRMTQRKPDEEPALIARLWVMSEDGAKLTPITLRT